MEWLRSCYSSEWRLFRDHPEVLTRGRYYFTPDDAPFVAGPTLYGSRVWDGNGTIEGTEPLDVFPRVLGEARDAKHRWDSGALPPALPMPITVGGASCLLDGGLLAHGVQPEDRTGGFPNACFLPSSPPNPDFEAGFQVWSCPTQLFWCDVITLLYSGHFDDVRAMCLARFQASTVTVQGGSKLFPPFVIVIHPQYACVAAAGTESLEQTLVQALQFITGPQDYGLFSTGKLWFDFASQIIQALSNAAALDGRPIVFAGHSYGGCAVMVSAVRLREALPKLEVRYITFGAPKPGDSRLVTAIREQFDGLSLVNDGDMLTALPPAADVIAAMHAYLPIGVFTGWTQWGYPPETTLMFQAQTLKNTYQRFDSVSLAQYILLSAANGKMQKVTTHTIEEYGFRIRQRCTRFLPTDVGEVFGALVQLGVSAKLGTVYGMTVDPGAIITTCCPAGTPAMLPFLFVSVPPPNDWLQGIAGTCTYDAANHWWAAAITTIHGPVTFRMICTGGPGWLLQLTAAASANINIANTCDQKVFHGAIITAFGTSLSTVTVGDSAPHTPQSVYSLAFDGTGWVSLPTVGLGTTHTISLWAKKTSALEQILISDAGGGYTPDIDSTTIYYNAANASLASVPHGGIDTSWHHWCIVRAGTSVTFYLDGVQLGGTQTLGVSVSLNMVIIGSRNNHTFSFVGDLDDVSVFTSALSAATVAAIAAGTTDVASLSPAGLWRFEEGSGTVATDTSGGGNNGTLTGGVTYSTDVPPPLA